MPTKAWEWFVFGLCFGMGLMIAEAVAHFISQLFASAHL